MLSNSAPMAGLPELHKQRIPIKPVISAIGAPFDSIACVCMCVFARVRARV